MLTFLSTAEFRSSFTFTLKKYDVGRYKIFTISYDMNGAIYECLLGLRLMRHCLTDKMKRSFFQAALILILLYGCTTWTLTKRLEKKLDANYTRMLRARLN